MSAALALALVSVLTLALAALLLYHLRSRRIMRALNQMLDEAIRGDFEAARYDESELSKIEAKLSRFLSASKLKKGQIEEQHDKIRALISDISHQTKTPIANMLLYAELLCEREDVPPEARDLATQIAGGAGKLSFLIQSLVKASRLESGIIKVQPQRAQVSLLVQAALDEYRPRAREKGVTLTAAALPEAAHALYDPKWHAEALGNLLDNAIKYTDSGGLVELSVTPYELFTRIDVRDSGQGIREEDLPRVFNRFWRGGPAGEGLGIGLYLAREIASAGGGYIKVSSMPGEGATFSIFLANTT